MNTFKRSLSLLFVSVALLAMATPMVAACRIDSPLDITQIIDPAQTKITPSSSKVFLVFFAVNTAKVSFRCDSGPAGCTKDGITYKPALSSNVAAAIQTPECRAFQINATNTGVVVAAFRIRFERGITPSRKTFKLTFNTNDPSKFTLTPIPEPIDLTD